MTPLHETVSYLKSNMCGQAGILLHSYSTEPKLRPPFQRTPAHTLLLSLADSPEATILTGKSGLSVPQVIRWSTAAMAESQLICMDDEHVNVKIPECRPAFYYSEEQRAALEQLLKNGDGAFKMRLKEDNIKDFLSAREIKLIRDSFQEYDSDSDTCCSQSPHDTSEDSGVHSTYWPTMSDTEIPPLDIGWPSNGHYKGVTRVSVYTHPPKTNSPHIKEVVRGLIQESTKVSIC